MTEIKLEKGDTNTKGFLFFKDITVYYEAGEAAAVATPVINYDPLTGDATITCATEGATIYYTFKDETQASSTADFTEYTGPVCVPNSCNLRAVATKGSDVSKEASKEIIVPVAYADLAAFADTNDELAKVVTDITVVFQSSNKKYTYVSDSKGNVMLLSGITEALTPGKTFYTMVAKHQTTATTSEAVDVILGTAQADKTPAEPQKVTLDYVTADKKNKYVSIANVPVTTYTNKQYIIEGSNVVLYNQFGLTLPTEANKNYDVTGFIGMYNQTVEVFITSLTEVIVKTDYDPELTNITGALDAQGKFSGTFTAAEVENAPAITYSCTSADVTISGNTFTVTTDQNEETYTINASWAENTHFNAGTATFTITVSKPTAKPEITLTIGETTVNNNGVVTDYAAGTPIHVNATGAVGEVTLITSEDSELDAEGNFTLNTQGVHTVLIEAENSVGSTSFEATINVVQGARGLVSATYNFTDEQITSWGYTFDKIDSNNGVPANRPMTVGDVTMTVDFNTETSVVQQLRFLGTADNRTFRCAATGGGKAQTITFTSTSLIKEIAFTGTKIALSANNGTLNEYTWTSAEGVKSVTFTTSGQNVFTAIDVKTEAPAWTTVPEVTNDETGKVLTVTAPYGYYIKWTSTPAYPAEAVAFASTDDWTTEENNTLKIEQPNKGLTGSETRKFSFASFNPVTNETSEPATLEINAEGNTTSINEISGAAPAAIEWFDLSGRKVAAPAKGIYIRRQGAKAVKVAI